MNKSKNIELKNTKPKKSKDIWIRATQIHQKPHQNTGFEGQKLEQTTKLKGRLDK